MLQRKVNEATRIIYRPTQRISSLPEHVDLSSSRLQGRQVSHASNQANDVHLHMSPLRVQQLIWVTTSTRLR
jgi:hypothetical protein